MADGEYMRLSCSIGACGGKHKAKGFCVKHYRQSQRGGAKEDATSCAHCRRPFSPFHVGSIYCSKRCKGCAWRAANLDRERAREKKKAQSVCSVYAGYCVGCGCAFVARRARQYCSEACRPARPYVSTQPSARPCACCGLIFAAPKMKTRPADFCSTSCRDAKRAANKRTARLKRKAAEKAVTVESVDPFKVFDRDRWTCKLCGVKTPKAKRGTYHDTAPELDHIIPLAQGGAHSYLNTQCACRKCNGLKSDRPLGQMLLIG